MPQLLHPPQPGRTPPDTVRVQVFYNILIPPIVFYAGFSVKKKLFFKNLVTIFIFGVLGCCATSAPPLNRTAAPPLNPTAAPPACPIAAGLPRSLQPCARLHTAGPRRTYETAAVVCSGRPVRWPVSCAAPASSACTAQLAAGSTAPRRNTTLADDDCDADSQHPSRPVTPWASATVRRFWNVAVRRVAFA